MFGVVAAKDFFRKSTFVVEKLRQTEAGVSEAGVSEAGCAHTLTMSFFLIVTSKFEFYQVQLWISVVCSSYALKDANKSSLSTTGALSYNWLCSAVRQILDTPPFRRSFNIPERERDPHNLSPKTHLLWHVSFTAPPEKYPRCVCSTSTSHLTSHR